LRVDDVELVPMTWLRLLLLLQLSAGSNARITVICAGDSHVQPSKGLSGGHFAAAAVAAAEESS
jgi:hypothetical protein